LLPTHSEPILGFRRTKSLKISSFITSAFLCVAPTFAAIIPLPFNTGVNSNGTVAAGGSVDQHFTSGQTGSLNTVFAESLPAGGWVAPDSLSAWVGPDTQSGMVNNGLYTVDYSVTFNLTGFAPNSVSLTGQISADDYAYIYLNGVNTGILAANFSVWTPFTLNSGFVNGINTIDFKVTNGGGPGGLRVEFASATATATPEPASVALIGLGVSGLALLRRKAAR
jgi:hypothetical protein